MDTLDHYVKLAILKILEEMDFSNNLQTLNVL